MLIMLCDFRVMKKSLHNVKVLACQEARTQMQGSVNFLKTDQLPLQMTEPRYPDLSPRVKAFMHLLELPSCDMGINLGG